MFIRKFDTLPFLETAAGRVGRGAVLGNYPFVHRAAQRAVPTIVVNDN
jgi:hypothetical protein